MKRTLATMLISGLLAACGGGGGGGSDGSDGSDPAPSQTEAPAPGSGSETPTNAAPVAAAGAGQSVLVGAVVTLDGTGSSDPDGNALSFAWSFVARPSGSTATLSNAAVAKPIFTPDVAGDYVVSLTVNDGAIDSAAATVTVIATAIDVNAAPIANAGSEQNVLVGAVVTLDGTGSSDANGDLLSYQWVLTEVPSGSMAVLSSATTAKPTFTADQVGAYVATLTVDDGKETSAADTVTVNAVSGNVPPVADAGADLEILIGGSVTLDGSGSSDANGDALSYGWVFVSKPAGSSVELVDADTISPSFTPDLIGSYVVRLTVDDGSTQDQDTVIVEAVAASFDDAPELSPAPDSWSPSRGVLTCTDYRIPATVISSKLAVPAGARCVLENGVTVTGQIEVGAGAELYVTGSVLEGSVSGEGAALVVIEDSTLNGSIVLLSGQQVVLRRNLIEGQAESSSNTGPVTLAGNRLPTGNARLLNNTGGVTVDVNEIGNTLDCQGNDPVPTGSGNVVGIAKLGQCELL